MDLDSVYHLASDKPSLRAQVYELYFLMPETILIQ